jgi:hypothetical protein
MMSLRRKGKELGKDRAGNVDTTPMHPIATTLAMDHERSVIWLPADSVWSVFLGSIQQILSFLKFLFGDT